MKAKKGKDIAESMILDDLFEDGKEPFSSSSKMESNDQSRLKNHSHVLLSQSGKAMW
ncbi:MAG: hypothetical protein IPK68_05380 [Bdellovibrionales bacterium]|nr:hypothetical protein [Bdellovibrionales bacterium]